MNKLYKILIALLIVNMLNIQYIFGANYLYEKKSKDKQESSISTVANPSFTFESEAQILMEPSTGRILYANNENERMLPASVTKVMTLLLIMEQIDSGVLEYTDTVTCSKNAASMGGSQIWFKEGEQLTIDEALKAICVVSANDVTVAMAELIGGNEERGSACLEHYFHKLNKPYPKYGFTPDGDFPLIYGEKGICMHC